jgi:ketosteroid isomerase-like protein
MRTCAVVASIAGFIVVGCDRGREEFSRQDESAVRAVADSVVRYFRTGNWAAWAELFSEDGILQPPNAPTVRGRAALVAYGKALPPIENLAFADVQVSGDGNLAYGTSSYRLTLQGLSPDTGKQLWVSRRAASGGWEVVAVSFNSDLALPGQTARTPSP